MVVLWAMRVSLSLWLRFVYLLRSVCDFLVRIRMVECFRASVGLGRSVCLVWGGGGGWFGVEWFSLCVVCSAAACDVFWRLSRRRRRQRRRQRMLFGGVLVSFCAFSVYLSVCLRAGRGVARARVYVAGANSHSRRKKRG